MDYSPPWLPSDEALQTPLDGTPRYYSQVVGKYDRHAIEYGYTAIAGEVSGVQPAALATLASKSAHDDELQFATDEDHSHSDGADPYTNVYDLGSDPLHYHIDHVALSQRLLLSAANRSVLDGESWTRQIVVVKRFLRAALSAGSYAAKYVGGFVFRKTHRGSGGPDPVTPVPPADQLRALQLSLQIVSQDFWLPAARSLRKMPTREGWCGELDEYCLGQGAAELLKSVQVCSRRHHPHPRPPSFTHSPSLTPCTDDPAARAQAPHPAAPLLRPPATRMGRRR